MLVMNSICTAPLSDHRTAPDKRGTAARTGQESRSLPRTPGPSVVRRRPGRGRHREGVAEMSDGFSAEERAAMKARAAELRAEGKKGAAKADGLQALLEAIAK